MGQYEIVCKPDVLAVLRTGNVHYCVSRHSSGVL
jgi:hypothetical protein